MCGTKNAIKTETKFSLGFEKTVSQANYTQHAK